MITDLIKKKKYRVWLTVGGDRLVYNDDAASSAASLLKTIFLLNSKISKASKVARFMTLDLKYFIHSYMERLEYIRIHSKYFMADMRKKYNIESIIAYDIYVYYKIKRGMYGLKQAAQLTYDALLHNLSKHGYAPHKYSPNIWGRKRRKAKKYLCVDDFVVQYTSKDDVDHLLNGIKEYYTITVD